MNCMYCENWDGSVPTPICMQRGGACCGFDNGCQCLACMNRERRLRRRNDTAMELSPFAVILLHEIISKRQC